MKYFESCACCGGKVHSSEHESAWSVVTAQVRDGHERNVYFISDNDDEVRLFAASVKPRMIYSSRYPTLQEAIEFVDEFLDGYDEIDPVFRH